MATDLGPVRATRKKKHNYFIVHEINLCDSSANDCVGCFPLDRWEQTPAEVDKWTLSF